MGILPFSSGDQVLFDWLTFTTTSFDYKEVIEILGLAGVAWKTELYGRYGYRQRVFFQGINIYWDAPLNEDGVDLMGVCAELSGTGCRTLEDLPDFSWSELAWVLKDPCFRITRLDIAFDDHSGILSPIELKLATDDHLYRSRSRTWELRYGSDGFTIYHGSMQSQIRIRIYDKAAERCLDPGKHWIRVELQLRKSDASGALKHYANNNDLGGLFSGILRNYLVYVSDTSDSNSSRWPVAEYWNKLLLGASSIHIAAVLGSDYNIFSLERYLAKQVSGALSTWISVFGIDALPDFLRSSKAKRLNPRHLAILEQYKDYSITQIEGQLYLFEIDPNFSFEDDDYE